MSEQVTRTKLSNGLLVQLKEIHSAPVISQWVWYRVGSRNEQPGMTGISHWVEHMQFKGTPLFPAGMLDRAISRDGGVWNAMTSLDWTTYYEKMPADKIDLALRLEANRMTESIYDPQEVESERTVVISELEGGENEPLVRLDKAIRHAAFSEHPYGHPVIGSVEDLNRIQRDDLYAHYRGNYVPNNAILAIAGDFDSTEMLNKIEEIYGAIPAGEVARQSIEVEPLQTQEKHVTVTGPDETTYVRLAYQSPRADSPDFFAFSVLDSLFSGPAGLNMFGGGSITNKTSRIYKALVEKEFAVAVGAGLQATIDPYIYDITAIVHPSQKWENVLSTIDGEISRLQDEMVSEAEIAKAVKQAKALFAYGSENITNQAFWLGYAEMFAKYEWFENFVAALEKITPQDVQRVAQTYLVPTRRVVGKYLPENTQEGAA
jgi:zinc protease